MSFTMKTYIFFYKMIIFLLLPVKIPWFVLILDFASAKFLQDKFTTLLINMKLTQKLLKRYFP